MLEAHTDAGFTMGEPFGHEGVYDFGGHTRRYRCLRLCPSHQGYMPVQGMRAR